jgi:hypothetical protein
VCDFNRSDSPGPVFPDPGSSDEAGSLSRHWYYMKIAPLGVNRWGFVLLSDALNTGLLDYFRAILGKMLSYHAVGEFFLGGSHRNNRLAQVYYRRRLTLERPIVCCAAAS